MRLAPDLDTLVPMLLERYDVAGCAIAVVENGTVAWTRGYGLADAETHVPVTPGTVFQVASISKTVTAWGIIRLVEQGIVDLDGPVDRYLTRWHLPQSLYNHDAITIRRLLNHTAGISVGGVKSFAPDAPLPGLEEHFSDAGPDGEVCVVQAPGAGHRYSGGGHTILQLVVEEVTGRPFAAFMQDEVLQPLGMEHSGFEWAPSLQPATASAYDREGRRVPNLLFVAKAAAGLYATAPDLATFAAAGLPGADGAPAGRGVLRTESVDAMYRPLASIGGPRDAYYGLGYVVKFAPNNVRIVGHTGDNEGWKAMFAAAPAKASAVVALTNSDYGSLVHGHIYRYWLRESIGVDDPARFFAATIDSGRLHPSGISDTDRWDSARFEWRGEHDVDALSGPWAEHHKITTWRELKALLEASVPGTEAYSAWIHEDLLYGGVVLWEALREGRVP